VEMRLRYTGSVFSLCRGEIAQRGVWALPVVKGIDVFERLLPSFLANPLFGTHSSL